MTRRLYITHQGVTRSRRQWARQLGIPPTTFDERVKRFGLARAMKMAPACKTRRRRDADTMEAERALKTARAQGATDLEVRDSIAAAYGVSRERARQYEVEALDRAHIGMQLVETLGQELGIELCEAMRGLPISVWRQKLRKWQRIASETRRAAA